MGRRKKQNVIGEKKAGWQERVRVKARNPVCQVINVGIE
jgi:hypothetical protein